MTETDLSPRSAPFSLERHEVLAVGVKNDDVVELIPPVDNDNSSGLLSIEVRSPHNSGLYAFLSRENARDLIEALAPYAANRASDRVVLEGDSSPCADNRFDNPDVYGTFPNRPIPPIRPANAAITDLTLSRAVDRERLKAHEHRIAALEDAADFDENQDPWFDSVTRRLADLEQRLPTASVAWAADSALERRVAELENQLDAAALMLQGRSA